MRIRLAFLLAFLLVALPLAAAEEGGGHGDELATTIFKWINFVTVFGLLGYFLYRPMKQFFADQRGVIQRAIAEGRQAREESRRKLEEVEQRLARLEVEIEALRREAAGHAVAERQRIQESARREAERILSTARAEMDSIGRAARLELRAYAARLAITLAEQRVRQQLTPGVHAALFESFLSGLVRRQEPERRV